MKSKNYLFAILALYLLLPMANGSSNKTNSTISSLNNFNTTDSVPSVITTSDILTTVNNERWTNSSIHKLNTTAGDFRIFSPNNLSSLTCRLMSLDNKTYESKNCLYTDHIGRIVYNNLSGNYIFRIQGEISGISGISSISRDYQFSTPLGKVVPSKTKPIPTIPPKTFNPLFEQCEKNPSLDNIAIYSIVGNMTSYDHSLLRYNSIKGDETKIVIYKNLINGTISGYIIEEKNLTSFTKKSLKASTDCEYSFSLDKEKLEASKSTIPNPNPFVGCGSRYVATRYEIYVNPQTNFNLTAGNDKEIMIGITNNFSGNMFGHLESYQSTSPFYQMIPFNVTKLSTVCIGHN